MFPAANAYQQYRQTQVNTASQEQLILMLYNGAIRFLGQAKTNIGEKNWQDANKFLIKAQDILEELMSTLNFEAGGDIAKNLFRLYEFMHNHLVQANIHKEIKPIDDVINLMTDLRDTWTEAFKKLKTEKKEVVNR